MSATAEQAHQLPEVSVRTLVRGRDVGDAVRTIEAQGGRYVVVRRGRAVAALVSLQDLATLEKLEGGPTLAEIVALARRSVDSETQSGPDAAPATQES